MDAARQDAAGTKGANRPTGRPAPKAASPAKPAAPTSASPAKPAAPTSASPASSKPTKTVATKGGDYPVYKRGSAEAKSFQAAYRAAKPGTFVWEGRKYKKP